jgi:hypothetical protein
MSEAYHDSSLPPLAYIWKRVSKHDRDLYEGNGKPSLTVRMESAEDCNERHEKRIAKVENGNVWAIRLLIAILVTLLADISKSAIFHIQ